MSNPFETLLATGGADITNADLARGVAAANEFDLRRYASELNDDQQHRAIIAIADRTRAGGTINALEVGALLTLFDHVITDQTRAEYYAEMEEETGISRTQLFRTSALFRRFGRELIADLDAASRCTLEALKILSGADVPEAAGDDALAYVRSGNRLTIKDAKNFIRQHARRQSNEVIAADENQSAGPKLPKATSVLWQHRESKLHVLVKRSGQDAVVDDETIMLALESALAAYRRVTVENQTPSQVA